MRWKICTRAAQTPNAVGQEGLHVIRIYVDYHRKQTDEAQYRRRKKQTFRKGSQIEPENLLRLLPQQPAVLVNV